MLAYPTKLYDICRDSGYKWFVITTYNHWIFGTWSAGRNTSLNLVIFARSHNGRSIDWSGVEITQVLPFDKTRIVTLVEILVFWVQSSRGKVRYWHPAPVSVLHLITYE